MADLDHVVARNIAELRVDRGWQQKDLAIAMSVNGLNWSPNRVSQIETLRRSVTLLELLALPWTFAVPIERLLAGDDEIDLPNRTTISLDLLRRLVTGDAQVDLGDLHRANADVQAQNREELRKLAPRLQLNPSSLQWLAETTWGRGFVAEHDRRAGDLSGRSERSARAVKAQATKTMIAELAQIIERDGRANIVLRAMADMASRTPGPSRSDQ